MPAEPKLNQEANNDPAAPPPRAAVIQALDGVIASAAFKDAERPSRFLRHLVKTALGGEGYLLKESVLGTDVFERPASWDPRLDPIVRQQAARLRKRLAKYYESSGANAEIRIELPVGSYVPVFLWKRREAGAASIDTPLAQAVSAAPSPVRGRRVWLHVATGLLCTAAAVIFWRALSLRASAEQRQAASIAVLPFVNLTAAPVDQYFADGLTDEITDSLARLKKLRVIAGSSAGHFKRGAIDSRDVGRSLNVSNVLEGSVERSGDRVKVIAHLERVSDGSLLWSNTYERKTSDLFAIQSELASGIAGSLRVPEGLPKVKHIPNAQAHDLLLKGIFDSRPMTTEALTRAEKEFQHAIDVDPEYAEAYAGLGATKYNQCGARGSAYQTEGERRSVEQLFHKALELDSDLPAPHVFLAIHAMQYDWNWVRAERELQLASSVSSTADAESYYAMLLTFRGRFREAEPHVQRMLDLDPLSTATMNNLFLTRNLEGRFAESRDAAQRLAAEYPKMIPPQLVISQTYIEEGHPDLALPIIRQLEPHFPQAQLYEAMACARAGRREEALRLLHPFEEKYPNSGVPMQWFALAYAFMGDEGNALKWLERSADRREFQALNLAVHPAYARMRNSPGFRALQARMGLVN